MYGNNPTEEFLRKHDGMQLDFVEIFSTIQGEGPYVGTPATFVRLAGCHLRCFFCDTDFTNGRAKMPLEHMFQEIMAYGPRLVVLTGGEPMRQNIVPLCEALADQNIRVQIETAGSFWPDGEYGKRLSQLILVDHVSIVVSPKTSFVHDDISNAAMAWKYIITDDGSMYTDGLPLSSTQDTTRRVRLARPPEDFPPESIFLQPCDYHDATRNKYAQQRTVKLCQKFGYRLSLQTHKIIGLP